MKIYEKCNKMAYLISDIKKIYIYEIFVLLLGI